MNLAGFYKGFSRLSFHTVRQLTARTISTNTTPLCFNVTNVLLGEPLKKKKRLDPAIIRHREERKRRKLEKQIRRLEKHARQLKPIDEVEVPFKLIDEKTKRSREISLNSSEVLEERILLEKKWTRYKHSQYLKDLQTIDSMVLSQKNALTELKIESQSLYQAAIQIDKSLLLPHITTTTANRPILVHTPLVVDYDSPDGDYIDISVKFEGEKIIN